ncbi:hypothetical protein TWF703_003102 [Orbilia oligospora]|uniref:Uncharacterized protein n=1 Tax=Orbilia oligospora TaxID=2813651 RepID=A0A7C8JT74_ORBOL|nr:hypothetical protein TWF703_003102 [Orbilia oligospora]
MAEKIMSVTIEACLKSDYTGPLRDVIPALRELVTGNYDTLSKGQVIDGGSTLAKKIERLDVSDTSETKGFEGVATSTARIRVHPYKYFKSLPQTIKIPMENETGDCCPTVLMHELPSVQLAASWDQLFFEPDIKPNLLRFVTSICKSSHFRYHDNRTIIDSDAERDISLLLIYKEVLAANRV